MDTTKNEKAEKAVQPKSKKRQKFTFLVILACFLSAGSLAYSTYSFLDLNKITAVPIERLGNLSLIGLSAAAMMDVIWGATMVAEYRGRRIMWKWGVEEPVNLLPFIGWGEVLAISAMLGVHGQQIGGWGAAFMAVIPAATKFTWLLAMDDIRNPNALTDAQKAEIAEDRRNALLAKEKSDATAALHEATLEALRRTNEEELETTRAAIQKKQLEQQAAFELKEAELRGANDLQILELTLKSALQIEKLQGQQRVELTRLDAEQEFRLQQPMIVRGEILRNVPGLELEQAQAQAQDVVGLQGLGQALNLSQAELRKVELAARYFAADQAVSGMSKTAFCKKTGQHLPRVSEATTSYPIEWFTEKGLGDLIERTADEYRQSMI